MEAIRLERRIPELLIVQGGARGLCYAAHPNNKKMIAICGTHGETCINRDQAVAIVRELLEVFDLYAGKGAIQYGEEATHEHRKRNGAERAV